MAASEGDDEHSISIRKKRSAEEAWRLDRDIIRDIHARDMQEENDRILARQLAGLPIEYLPGSVDEIGMITNDDDDDNEIHCTNEASSTEIKR